MGRWPYHALPRRYPRGTLLVGSGVGYPPTRGAEGVCAIRGNYASVQTQFRISG